MGDCGMEVINDYQIFCQKYYILFLTRKGQEMNKQCPPYGNFCLNSIRNAKKRWEKTGIPNPSEVKCG